MLNKITDIARSICLVSNELSLVSWRMQRKLDRRYFFHKFQPKNICEGVFSLTWSCQDGCNYKHVSLTYGFGWSMFFFTIWHWRFSLLQSDLIEKILGSPPAHHFCHQLLFHHAHPVAKQEVCRTKNFDQGRLRRNPPWSEQCEITVFWLNLWGHINYMTRSHKPFKTP